MTTEKICFRYDGSEEAKQCIEWINSTNRHLSYLGLNENYYDSIGRHWQPKEPLPPMRIVTPAEFLRLVNVENEWTPKYGEEVEVSDDDGDWVRLFFLSKKPDFIDSNYSIIAINNHGSPSKWKHIRPVHKSVREEIEYILSCRTVRETQIDEIMSLIKQRKDEL